MQRFRFAVTIVLLLLAVKAFPAFADLPTVMVPTDPGEPRLRTSSRPNPQNDEQERMNQLMEAQRQRMMEMEGIHTPPAASHPVDQASFQLMMKSVTDPSVLLPDDIGRQMQEMKAFGSLQTDRQNEATPELLALLKNRRALARGNLQIRHKALAALSRMAGVSFGQFSSGTADEAARAADMLIIAQWKAWWEEVRDLDEEARKKASSAQRLAIIEQHLETPGDELTIRNVTFAREAGDASALPLLARMLEAPDVDRKDEILAILRFYQQIYASAKPGAEHVRPLLEFARAVNTVEISHRTQWVRQVGSMLGQMTGVRMNTFSNDLVTIEEDSEERKINVLLIRPEAMTAFAEWLETATKQD